MVEFPADPAARPMGPRLRDKTMGDLILFDPTDYYIPFGLLPAADQGGNALIVSPATEDVARIPYAGPEANRHELQLDGRMDTNGDLSVSAIERFGGGMGDWLRGRRQSVTQNDFSSTLESRLHANTQFVDGLVWKDNGPRSEQWEIGYTYKALSFLHPTSTDLVMVPLPKLWAEQSIRPWPVNLEGKSYVESESLVKHLRLVLPQGFTIEELPDPLDKRIGTASCRLSYQTDGNAVVYQCSYQREGGILSRAAYEALRLFDQEILDAENRPLLVRGQLTTR
jgi:hypothetical protein